MPRMCDALLHATLCLTAAGVTHQPGRSQEGKVTESFIFKVNCHVKAQDGDEEGVNTCLSTRHPLGTDSLWDSETFIMLVLLKHGHKYMMKITKV